MEIHVYPRDGGFGLRNFRRLQIAVIVDSVDRGIEHDHMMVSGQTGSLGDTSEVEGVYSGMHIMQLRKEPYLDRVG